MSDSGAEYEKIITAVIEENRDLFPTDASFWTWLRGCLRLGLWNKSPLKHRYKQRHAAPPPENYTGRGKKGAYCSLTGEWIPISYLEVDHKKGHMPLRSVEDILPFIFHMIAQDKELQLVSKEAHRVKSYAERQGISFEEAAATKKAIEIQKDNKVETKWFEENKLTRGSNAKERRKQIIDYLLNRSDS